MLIFHWRGIATIPYLPTKEKEYKMKSLVSFLAILMLCSCGLRTYDNRTTFAKILDEPEDYVDEIVVIEAPIQEYKEYGHILILRTNKSNIKFHITTVDGKPILFEDATGKLTKFSILNVISQGYRTRQYKLTNRKYRFECVIKEIKYDKEEWIIRAELTYNINYPKIIPTNN